MSAESKQNRLVQLPLVETEVEGKKVKTFPIVEVGGVEHAAECPDCGAENRPLVFLDREPHAVCGCEPRGAA